MNRAALLTITLLSGLATPFVVQATTPAPREAAAPAAVVQTAAAETPAKAAEPACGRKVKVVYAGYGEASTGAACPAEAQAAK